MTWGIIVISIVIGLMIVKQISTVGSVRLDDLRDAFKIIKRLKATPWSRVIGLTPEQRARCLVLPGVDDVKIIEALRAPLEVSMTGTPAQCRARFTKHVGRE